MKNRTAFAVMCFTLLTSSTVMADDHKGDKGRFFGKIYGGINMLGDQDISQNGVAASGATSNGSFDTGWAAGAAAGYFITDKIAAELAWDYRTNNNDSVNFSDGTNFSEGDFSSNIFFVNGYYHFDPVINTKFRPYLGAGLGFVEEIDLDLERNGVETSYSEDGEFAYQFIAGMSYELTDNWDLTTDARYLRVDGIDLQNESGAGTLKDVDYDPISIMVGATYKF